MIRGMLLAVLLMGANSLAQTHRVPRTPWGDPDLQGTYTNKNEVSTPFERPAEFRGRQLEDISPAEIAAILKRRDDDRPGVQANAAGRIGPTEWRAGPRYDAYRSRTRARCTPLASRIER